ncbi:MAG: hypothetical protein ACR2PS_17640 [Pseudomonadales bacterium]
MKSKLAAILVALATTSGVVANAEPKIFDETPLGQWRFELTPYLFLPTSTEGSSVIDGVGGDLDLDLQDVLSLLQGAASVRFEAWSGNWGIITDAYYVYLNPNDTLTLPGPTSGTIDVDADIRQGWLTLLGANRIAKGTNAAGRSYFVDAAAGVKWNSLEQTVEIDVTVPPGGGVTQGQTLGGTETWWEPTIALRGALEVADRWTLVGLAELGGFGVNGNDLQYLVRLGADWQAWEKNSLRFGWQFYGIDYSSGSGTEEFTYDVDQHGLYLGLTVRF